MCVCVCVCVYMWFFLFCCCFSVTRLCLTLLPHGLQRARLPCASLSLGVRSNSCPLKMMPTNHLILSPPSPLVLSLSQHSFTSKEQACFKFVSAVTDHSNFEAQENISLTVSTFSPSICHEVMGPYAMILVFWVLSFKPAFSLLFSPSSRGCYSILLHFLPLGWCHLHIWGYWYSSGNLDSSLCFFQPSISHDVLCI